MQPYKFAFLDVLLNTYIQLQAFCKSLGFFKSINLQPFYQVTHLLALKGILSKRRSFNCFMFDNEILYVPKQTYDWKPIVGVWPFISTKH